MKQTSIPAIMIAAIITLSGCGNGSHQHDHHEHAGEAVNTAGNEALVAEVDKVHNEAMSKMDEIITLKQTLTAKAEDASLDDTKKTEIQSAVSKLDSANEAMMDWMHKFRPLPDSLGEEKAREYLETEMEKIKSIRETIDVAIEKGNTLK